MSDAKTDSDTQSKTGTTPEPAKSGTPPKPVAEASAKSGSQARSEASSKPGSQARSAAAAEASAKSTPAPKATTPTEAATARPGVQARLSQPVDAAAKSGPQTRASAVADTKAVAKPKPRPQPRTAPAPAASAEEYRTQFLRVYLKHRVGERLDGFERGRVKYTSARRWTGALSVLLLAGAAALGALAAADATRRPMWGFLAAVVAALATAVAWYESAFGLRRLARRSSSGAALLEILQAHGAASDEDGVAAFVTEVESVLRHSD